MADPAVAPVEERVPAPGSTDEIGRRIEAALAVLGGESPAVVAARAGVEVELVERWCDLFIAGGCNGVAGRTEPATASRDRFLALASHEFMTPLTVVRGWAETLLGAPDLPEEVRNNALEAVARAARQLERIAHDCLDAAAVALGRFRLIVHEVELTGLVARAIADFGEDRVRLAPSPPAAVTADPERVEQVLRNLLANAVQHGGPGPIEVTVTGGVDHVLVTVSNEGTIHPDAAYALFEPWVRSGGAGGRGLGLYACRAVVAAHGGHIGARGEDDRTEFWFRLPIEGPPSALLVDRQPDLPDHRPRSA